MIQFKYGCKIFYGNAPIFLVIDIIEHTLSAVLHTTVVGAYKTYQYAKRKKKHIFNVTDKEI